MSAECKGLKLKLNADIHVLEACSAKWVLVSARQNLCCMCREFWSSLAITHSDEYASVHSVKYT